MWVDECRGLGPISMRFIFFFSLHECADEGQTADGVPLEWIQNVDNAECARE